MDNRNNESFSYTYSAKVRREISDIRKRYAPAEEEPEDKLTRIRRLDEGVTKKASAVSLIVGIAGALVMGFGMSLVMSPLGTVIGLGKILTAVISVLTGIVGIVLVSLAYPVYNGVVSSERAKIAPEMLRLADELLEENK